jgi:multidrug efflux system membrane fusion protein
MFQTRKTKGKPMHRFLRISYGRAIALAIATLAIVASGVAFSKIGHSAQASAAAHNAAAAAAPAVPVTAETLVAQPVKIWSTFSGRMRAVDFAEVRPEVSGRIVEVRITDGQLVKAGDLLFVIDPAPYQAADAKAQADLATAKSNAAFASTELERAVNLVKTDAIAQRLYDERANADKVAQAAVLSAEAEVKQARINLDRAYVKAPIAGRVSRAEITVGNVVQAGAGAPVLTSIVSRDGIYADFEVDEQTYLRGIRGLADSRDKERRIPVQLTVNGDESHRYNGTIHSFDNRIDTSSGTIRARALFDNRDGSLVPGMFVSVRVASGGADAALLVPERAIGTDQNKRFVFVVGDGDKVAYREVTLGAQVDSGRIVQAGLKAGDRVITDGLQHLRPDMPVSLQPAAQARPAGRATVASN